MSFFRTSLKLVKQKSTIDYNSNILLIGSCFTEHISKKLEYFKFNTLSNPYGILFNSSAIKTAINQIIENKTYTKADLKLHNNLWFSFNHHSQFSSPQLEKALTDINTNILEAHQFIKKASHIVITIGTAWVYTNNDSNKIVANCHKIPQLNFTKSLQNISQIIDDLNYIYNDIKTVNNKSKILLTVSPVRHLRNGFTENMLSKAHLISAIQKSIINKKDGYYFPSYEIMMDDLRDYRFYESDMIHPNGTAINYIWNYFKDSWISNKAMVTMKEVDNIQKDLQHRPFNKDTETYKNFKINLNKKIMALKIKQPSINF